jgi:HSP90 family molecular chaperone
MRTKELSVPQKHQKQIAIKTLRMSDAGASIMGGMSKDEAREFLASIGYSAEQIERIENCENY